MSRAQGSPAVRTATIAARLEREVECELGPAGAAVARALAGTFDATFGDLADVVRAISS